MTQSSIKFSYQEGEQAW
ncbi:hypothetical protein JMJ77_0000099 [Colletotrichum scovillei]|uniref:Uncharacterized protein n=1 Tax=Colletotrichum scovillei TaxID=1209932 RepID=A0A9P7UEM4_9PEZI|nr:hypothetical protein JMJ77_0000099 [Colletotrichum scovillei]KAG7071300.1 hypothetical protein JMJ76_0004173 [Colletotrichum scovillei]KAG7079588.1 hypothetical protein JMJ78_0006694 [Colletotrichum scovillei]